MTTMAMPQASWKLFARIQLDDDQSGENILPNSSQSGCLLRAWGFNGILSCTSSKSTLFSLMCESTFMA
jgi:hypothetical protein